MAFILEVYIIYPSLITFSICWYVSVFRDVQPTLESNKDIKLPKVFAQQPSVNPVYVPDTNP